MKHDNCIFCQIVAGEQPSAKVYEDEYVYAFLDISQVTEGHTLIIPKMHVKDIYELPEDIAGKLFQPVPKIAQALKRAFNADGINLLNNNEITAGQSVFHIHIHLIPRFSRMNDGFGVKWMTRNHEFNRAQLQQIAEKISNQLI